jgi:hypothetical protein
MLPTSRGPKYRYYSAANHRGESGHRAGLLESFIIMAVKIGCGVENLD